MTTALRTVAIVQARMGSQRLPGKVMRSIAGIPMIEWVLRRLAMCNSLHGIVVATTTDSYDDRLSRWLDCNDWLVFRGKIEDVLSRYVQAADCYDADVVVRITADCPLIDPRVVDEVVAPVVASQCDYASNVFPQRTFPRGLDTECLTRQALEIVAATASRPPDREHVTRWIHHHPSYFRIREVTHGGDCSDLRWTVDTEDDLRLVSMVCDYFGNRSFGWQDVLNAYDDNPHWREVNKHVPQQAA